MTLLEYLRRELGLTQKELEEKSGVSQTWISQFEREAKEEWSRGRKEALNKLSDFFDESPDELKSSIKAEVRNCE